MTDLITRLSKLDAPDREVDIELWRMFERPDAEENKIPLPWVACYTSSIDTVVALIAKILPGWSWSLFPHAAEIRHPKIRAKDQMAGGFNTATALCIALLRAKEASNA